MAIRSKKLRAWVKRSYDGFYSERDSLLAAHIKLGSSIAVLGSESSHLLSSSPCDEDRSLVIDIADAPKTVTSTRISDGARLAHVPGGGATPLRTALAGRQFDAIVVPAALPALDDAQATLEVVRDHLVPDAGQLLICTYSTAWRPALNLAEKIGLRSPAGAESTFSLADLRGLLSVAGFRVEDSGVSAPIPFHAGRHTQRANAAMARLPGIRHAGLIAWAKATPDEERPDAEAAPTCSVICCCRNEAGNVLPSVERIPAWPGPLEIIFVDGASTDGTLEEIGEAMERLSTPGLSIRLIHQVGPQDSAEAAYLPDEMLRLGKGDALRKGLAAASGDICIIMDPELTVPPEVLPKFYEAIRTKRADFANGTRLIYPMAREAMPVANLLGNKVFGYVFSWLLGSRVTDTLCANKAFWRRDYERIAATHSYFGDFDPFGDFELLFGASYLGMRIREIPVRYQPRVAGESKVSVFRHGPILARMTAIGFVQLKLRPWLQGIRRR